jgi:ERCC4-type nuclease
VVEVQALPAGDYDVGNGALVERKTVRDLHESIRSGRLWPQLGRLRRLSTVPYVLIEGQDLDRGPLEPNLVRGACLAVLGQGVGVIWTQNVADSARWLDLLAKRRDAGRRPRRDRPAYAQRRKATVDDAGEAMLAAVPGISSASARELLRRFHSVAAVVQAGPRAWETVPGIGRAKAEALRRAVT